MKPQYIGGTEARKLEAPADNIETEVVSLDLYRKKKLGGAGLEVVSEDLGTESAGEVVSNSEPALGGVTRAKNVNWGGEGVETVTSELPKPASEPALGGVTRAKNVNWGGEAVMSELPQPVEAAGHKRPEAKPATADASGEDSPAEGGVTIKKTEEDRTFDLLNADGDNNFNFGQVEIAGEKKKGRYEQIEEMATQRVLAKLEQEHNKNRTLSDLVQGALGYLGALSAKKKLQETAVGSEEERRLLGKLERQKDIQEKNKEFIDKSGVIPGIKVLAGIVRATGNTLKYGMFKPYTAAIAMSKERKNIMKNGMFGEEDAEAKSIIATRIAEGGADDDELKNVRTTDMIRAKIGEGESLTDEENRLLYRENFLRDTLNSVSASIVNGGMSKETAMTAFKAAVAREREKGSLDTDFVQRADNFDAVAERMINKVFEANKQHQLSTDALKKYINEHVCLTEGTAKVGPEVKTKVDRTTELLMRGTAGGIALGTALFAVNKFGRAGIKLGVTATAIAVATGASPIALLATSGALAAATAQAGGVAAGAATIFARGASGALYGAIRGAQSTEQKHANRDLERARTGEAAKYDTDFQTATNVKELNAELTRIFGSAEKPKKFEDLTQGEKEKVAKLCAEIDARSEKESERKVILHNLDGRDENGVVKNTILQKQKLDFDLLRRAAREVASKDDNLAKIYDNRKREYEKEVNIDIDKTLKRRLDEKHKRMAISGTIGAGMSNVGGAIGNKVGSMIRGTELYTNVAGKLEDAADKIKEVVVGGNGISVTDNNAAEIIDNDGNSMSIRSIEDLRGQVNAEQFTQAEVVRDADGGKAIYVNMAEDNDLTDGNGGHVMMTQVAGLGDKGGFRLSKDGEVKLGSLEKSGFGEGDTADMKILVDEDGDGTADSMMTMEELKNAVASAKESGENVPKIWTDTNEDKMVLVQDTDGSGNLTDSDKIVTVSLHAKGNAVSEGQFTNSWNNENNATQFMVENDKAEVQFGSGETQEVHALVNDGGYDSMDNTHFDLGRERNNFDAPLISGEYDVSNLTSGQYAEAVMNLQNQVITDPHSSMLWWDLLLGKGKGDFNMAEHNSNVDDMISNWTAGQQDSYFNRVGQGLMNLIRGGEVKFMRAGDFEHTGALCRASFFQADRGDGSVVMGATHNIATAEDDPIMIIKNFVDRDGNGEFDDINGDGVIDDKDMVNVFMQDEEQIQRIARAAGVPEGAKILAIGIRGKCGQPEVLYEKPEGDSHSDEDDEITTFWKKTFTVGEKSKKVPVSDPKKEVTTDEEKSDPVIETTTEKKSDPTIETTTRETDGGVGETTIEETDGGVGEGTTDENTEGTVIETDGGAGEGTTDENTEGTVIETDGGAGEGTTDENTEGTVIEETDPTNELTAKNAEALEENMGNDRTSQLPLNEEETPLTEEPDNEPDAYDTAAGVFGEAETPEGGVSTDGEAIVAGEDADGNDIIGHVNSVEENTQTTLSGDLSGRTEAEVQAEQDQSAAEDLWRTAENMREAEAKAAEQAAGEVAQTTANNAAAASEVAAGAASGMSDAEADDWFNIISGGGM